MSLPAPNQPWPPERYTDLVADTAIAQAWWEGAHDKLAGHYGDTPQGRPIQYAGGILGAVGRTFWGKPPAKDREQPRRLHIPVAADLCTTSATILLPDPVSYALASRDGIDTGNEQARKRIDLMLNSAENHGRMLAAAEACAALGGTYPRIVWNADVADHAWIDYVDADRAIPEFVYGKLSAVTFWTVLEDDGTNVWRHFERYEKGRIWHGLYVGNLTNTGHPIPLSEHPETRGIPVTSEDGYTGWIPTGTNKLCAEYIPNATPNPRWRTKGHLRNLGRSDITDPSVIGLMDAIDETYSSLARDIRLAKARLVVSEHLLDVHGGGRGATFDIDQEVYSPVGGSPTDGNILEAHQFDIRVDQHLRTAEAYLRQILLRVGYDPGTFGLSDDGAAMTATEVDAKDRRNVSTHKAKAGLWRAPLPRLSQALVEVDAAVFRTGAQVGEPLEVTWPPAARESMRSRAQTVQTLETARAISVETKVAMLWSEKDEAWRAEEVARILAEQSGAGDPFAIGADMMPGGGPVVVDDLEPDEDDLAEAAEDTEDLDALEDPEVIAA